MGEFCNILWTSSNNAGFEPIPATPIPELEAVIEKLDSKKAEWATLTTLKRAALLRETLKCVIAVRHTVHRNT